MKVFPKKIIYVILFIFFVFSPVGGEASVGLSVSPQKIDKVIFPGETYRSKFRLGNQSQVPLPVSVNVVAFGADDVTGEMHFNTPDPYCPSLWFNFESTNILLDPEESKVVNFMIKVPDGAEPGGYYVFIYFQPTVLPSFIDGVGPKVLPVVGVPVLISTAFLEDLGEGYQFDVVDFSVSKNERISLLEDTVDRFKRGGVMLASVLSADSVDTKEVKIKGSLTQVVRRSPDSFSITIKNNDIYHIKPSGTLFVYNVLGMKVGEASFQGQTVLPGKSRELSIKMEEKVGSGFLSLLGYTAGLDVKAISPVRGTVGASDDDISLYFFSVTSLYIVVVLILILSSVFLLRRRIKAVAVYLVLGKK